MLLDVPIPPVVRRPLRAGDPNGIRRRLPSAPWRGIHFVEPEAWIAHVANGLPEGAALLSAKSQAAGNTSIFEHEAEAASWRDKPAWSAIATAARIIAPERQLRMSERSGATVVEIDGGHPLPMADPDEVTRPIEKAAASVD